MTDFSMHILSPADGTWGKFTDDWEAQCAEVGDSLGDYALDSLPVLFDIVQGNGASLQGTNTTVVGALWDEDTKHYYASCMLNHAYVPGHSEKVLRVRHIVVSPLLDYGLASVDIYPDVIIGILQGVVQLSSTILMANEIRLHLRSPEDQAFFRVIGTNLGASGVFASVQTHGAWLYITKA